MGAITHAALVIVLILAVEEPVLVIFSAEFPAAHRSGWQANLHRVRRCQCHQEGEGEDGNIQARFGSVVFA